VWFLKKLDISLEQLCYKATRKKYLFLHHEFILFFSQTFAKHFGSKQLNRKLIVGRILIIKTTKNFIPKNKQLNRTFLIFSTYLKTYMIVRGH